MKVKSAVKCNLGLPKHQNRLGGELARQLFKIKPLVFSVGRSFFLVRIELAQPSVLGLGLSLAIQCLDATNLSSLFLAHWRIVLLGCLLAKL